MPSSERESLECNTSSMFTFIPIIIIVIVYFYSYGSFFCFSTCYFCLLAGIQQNCRVCKVGKFSKRATKGRKGGFPLLINTSASLRIFISCPLSTNGLISWREYLKGRDGINGRDWEGGIGIVFFFGIVEYPHWKGIILLTQAIWN